MNELNFYDEEQVSAILRDEYNMFYNDVIDVAPTYEHKMKDL